MLETLEKKLRSVWFRCSINLLLKHIGRILTAVGIIVLLTVLTDRLLALGIIDSVNSRAILSFSAAAIILILLLWLMKQPSRMQVSLLLDERLKLSERFSTTLALADSDDPFADAARNEAKQKAQQVNIQGHFPIRPSRCWMYAVSTWLIAAAIIFFMPQKDLLGFLRKDRQQKQRARQLEQTKVDIKEAADPVKLAIKQMGEPELAEALSKLDQTPKDARPQDIKRQAIRQLGDLSKTIQQMQSGMKLDSVNQLQKMFKQLRGSSDAFSQKLRLALAKGRFSQASNIMSELQKELAKGNLSPEQQKAFAGQLQDLAKRLQELAQKNEELEKELEKLGLNKELAKLSEQQLRQALQKQGLAAENIEELLRKASAMQSAASMCAGLGSAMAACGMGAGQLSGEGLAAAAMQLDEFDALKQQLMLTQASLDEISNAIACLGEGMGQGLGGLGSFMEGLSNRSGPGTGGAGVGFGPRGTAADDTSTQRTRLKNKPGQGPAIASWYFQESQIKGEAKRDFTEVVQAARDGAAAAISENEIPRKYEEAIKKYFGRLEESGGE
ncbi:MAG: hypothetical protein ACYSUX_07190 [Planctomycetota bacterium]|jgi:hypothetical protein